MSKADGQYIGVKFTEGIVGDITITTEQETQSGEWTANGTYSGSIADIKDGSTATLWQSRSTENYIQIARPNTSLTGFKVYKGSSYRPTSFTLQASADGVSYADIAAGNLVAATGWETISLDEPIKTDYLRIRFGYSSRLYLYELVLLVAGTFIVSGREYEYVPGGGLKSVRYNVISASAHPTQEKSILLEIDPLQRFNNAIGTLTVAYDALSGTLAGEGGPVESFAKTFLPTDLLAKPHQNDQENIEITGIDATGTLTKIYYANTKEDENIEISSISATGTLTHIDDL